MELLQLTWFIFENTHRQYTSCFYFLWNRKWKSSIKTYESKAVKSLLEQNLTLPNEFCPLGKHAFVFMKLYGEQIHNLIWITYPSIYIHFSYCILKHDYQLTNTTLIKIHNNVFTLTNEVVYNYCSNLSTAFKASLASGWSCRDIYYSVLGLQEPKCMLSFLVEV